MKKVLFLLLAILATVYTEDAVNAASATLSITTEPIGVSVIIDEKTTLKSPFTTKLSPGSHVLVFKKNGFYGKKITVDLGEGKSISKKIELRAPGKLNIVTEPLGATVILAGDTVGTTPYTSKAIKPGEYGLTIFKEGFESVEQNLLFASGEEKELSITLTETIIKSEDSIIEAEKDSSFISESYSGGLSLNTVPDSALVIIDNKDTLFSPFSVKLPEGEHDLVLKKKGFYSKKVKLTIPADTVLKQTITLRAPSYLSIFTNVDSCRILLNKESVGITPYTSKAIKAGSYEIIVLKNGYKTYRSTVEVGEGVHKKLNLTLESKSEQISEKTIEEKQVEKKERKKVAIIAGAVFGAFLTMITAFELSGVGE